MDYNIYGGDKMSAYKKMYYTLFNRVTSAIEELRAAQHEVEEMYISGEGDDEIGEEEQE